MNATEKKITLATIKSFIRKNRFSLLIRTSSSFDGMTDCVQETGNREFVRALATNEHPRNTLGICGAWFVGGSRNYFEAFENADVIGYVISNCCGCFTLATPKE